MAEIGSVIDNKYEILKQIGKGGMSTVYLAMDKRLNKQWAIKEVRKNIKDNEIAFKSFIVETNLMKKLDHPALPRIVDIIDINNTIYVVMDYIEGESLDKILKVSGAQPQEMVVEWAKQLCDVLRYLHTQKVPIIYRDMKPSNIMLKPEGTLKLIDFGIAREYKGDNAADTVSLGTRGYAAPEQFGGMGQTDARTDIYSLGVTLYHLLTGQNPAEPPYEIYPIRHWKPSLSSGLEYIVQKCTQLNPDDRYQSCDELMYDLMHYYEMDDSYKSAQRKKLSVFIVSLIVTVTFFTSSIVFKFLYNSENDKDYGSKINVSSSTDYDVKMSMYKEAIALYPHRAEAYIKMIEAYLGNEKFSDAESNEFMNYYNNAFSNGNTDYDVKDLGFAELNYQAGLIYFYVYNSDDPNVTLKVRALKAYPFFENIVTNAPKEYEHYDIAKSYYTVCEFYKKYSLGSFNRESPQKENYEELLTAINECILNLDEYNYADEQYVKLTIYRAIVDLIHGQRQTMANVGVDFNRAYSIINVIYDKVEEMSGVVIDNSVEIREEMLANKRLYLQDILDAFDVSGVN